MIAKATTPDGGTYELARHGDDFAIYSDGRVLMTSRTHGSEEAMAAVVSEIADRPRPRVLVGGLGFGFTLRATLDRLPAGAEVVCAELMEATVEWHRGPLGSLAAHPIDDPRVRVLVGDVAEHVRELRPADAYDAILLDVDNGPLPMTVVGNWWLYAAEGIAGMHAALRDRGVLVVWSAGEDHRFERRLRDAGFTTDVRRVTARGRPERRRRRGETHVLFVGRRA